MNLMDLIDLSSITHNVPIEKFSGGCGGFSVSGRHSNSLRIGQHVERPGRKYGIRIYG
jgi:hypothetical protein